MSPQSFGEQEKERQAAFEYWQWDLLGETERQVWRDAYGIAVIGASNAAGVSLAVHQALVALRSASYKDTYFKEPIKDAWDYADHHPAIRAMAAHLLYLTGQGIGPMQLDLELVTRMHDQEELAKKAEAAT